MEGVATQDSIPTPGTPRTRGFFADELEHIAAGRAPTAALFDGLRPFLRAELRRRGIWDRPAYVGCPEIQRWSDDGALDSLAADFICAQILPKLPRLLAKIEIHGNIDSLISGNVSRFFTDRQRLADRVGHAIYTNLFGAVEFAVEEGTLEARGTSVKTAHLAAPGTSATQLSDTVAIREAFSAVENSTWFLGALSVLDKKAQRRLAACLPHMFAVWDLVATVRRLVSAVRDDIRGAHTARLEWAEPAELPEADLASLERLESTLRERIQASNYQTRTRTGLETVLDVLLAAVRADEDPFPTHAELARRVNMSESTFSDHIRRLRELLAEVVSEDRV